MQDLNLKWRVLKVRIHAFIMPARADDSKPWRYASAPVVVSQIQLSIKPVLFLDALYPLKPDGLPAA